MFEAKAGLRKAAIRFDPSRGAPLFPLASMYIKKQLNSLREQQSRPITAPVGGHEKLLKLKRIERELTKELGRPPTVEVVAAKVNNALASVFLCRYKMVVHLNIFLPRIMGLFPVALGPTKV